MTTDEAPITPALSKRIGAWLDRKRANWLDFPKLCSKSACRRIGKCSADPEFCMNRLAPMVPDNVREGVDMLIDAQVDKVPFDELLSKAPAAMKAVHRWHTLVAQHASEPAPDRAAKSKTPRAQRHGFH